jgi:DNA-binding MarR family transcriptional regulator
MSAPSELIHQATRLRMMAALNALGARELLEFKKLRSILAIPDGNMSPHLAALEKAGYIHISKDFVGKKPRTRIGMTAEGKRAFRDHIAYLRTLIDEATP